MEHRGETVQKVIKNLGINLSVLSNSIGVSRATLYRYFDTADLQWKTIYDIGNVIRYDFKKVFPEMPLELIERNTALITDVNDFPNDNIYDLKKQLIEYQSKYIELLEKYSKLLEKQQR